MKYCFIDKVKLLKCETNICSGKYSSYHKNYLFECHENSESLVEVHITTDMKLIEENILNKNKIYILEHKIIRYTCMFNKCNDQYLTDKLINIVEEYFQLSLMRDAFFNYSFINKQEFYLFHYSNLSYQTTSNTDKREYLPSISIINDYLFNNLSNNKSHLSIFIILTLLYLNIIDHLFKQI
ncbi:unnamed protein product [Rotaria sordida]|uniref:Uncharacterized protein n=1 Tax=Rotaria sordida TaxID=392033 RepID=A0A815D5F7_9BILA|nr:unnamed protein product [Rotaria sordida]